MEIPQISRKIIAISAGAFCGLLIVVPPVAKALDWDIFSAIESTISSDIGGALTSMTSIQNALRQDQQTLLFPVSVINQSHNYISTIMTSYRGGCRECLRSRLTARNSPTARAWRRYFSAVRVLPSEA